MVTLWCSPHTWIPALHRLHFKTITLSSHHLTLVPVHHNYHNLHVGWKYAQPFSNANWNVFRMSAEPMVTFYSNLQNRLSWFRRGSCSFVLHRSVHALLSRIKTIDDKRDHMVWSEQSAVNPWKHKALQNLIVAACRPSHAHGQRIFPSLKPQRLGKCSKGEDDQKHCQVWHQEVWGLHRSSARRLKASNSQVCWLIVPVFHCQSTSARVLRWRDLDHLPYIHAGVCLVKTALCYCCIVYYWSRHSTVKIQSPATLTERCRCKVTNRWIRTWWTKMKSSLALGNMYRSIQEQPGASDPQTSRLILNLQLSNCQIPWKMKRKLNCPPHPPHTHTLVTIVVFPIVILTSCDSRLRNTAKHVGQIKTLK